MKKRHAWLGYDTIVSLVRQDCQRSDYSENEQPSEIQWLPKIMRLAWLVL